MARSEDPSAFPFLSRWEGYGNDLLPEEKRPGMRIQFLGTAAAEAVPALFCKCAHCEMARRVGGREIRTRSGALIDGKIKLDFGPDSYLHALRFGLNYADVHTVLITHSHEDHLDTDEITLRREVCAHLDENDQMMRVFGNHAVGEKLAGRTGSMIIFQEVMAFRPFEAEGYLITPLQALHMAPGKGHNEHSVFFRGEEVLREEDALIYLIEKDGRRILYAHDTDELTDEDLDYLKGRRCDIISLDCTNGALDLDYIGHMGASDNLRMRKKLIEIGAADGETVFVANHFSHNGLRSCAEMQELLPGFIVAWDGLTVSVQTEVI